MGKNPKVKIANKLYHCGYGSYNPMPNCCCVHDKLLVWRPLLSVLWSAVEGTMPSITLNGKNACVSVLHMFLTESMVKHIEI